MLLYDHQPGGTVARARLLRRDATEAEKKLLRGLRDASPSRKWRFQVPMGPYYADILCFSEKLIVEIDGGQHADAAEHDARRTAFIEGKGFRVVRVQNNDVLGNLEGVLSQISLSFLEKDGVVKPKRARDRTKKKGEQAEARSPSPFRSASRTSLPLPRGEGV